MSAVETDMQDRAFWRVRHWCADADICPTKFYKLPPEQRPLATKIGGTPAIVESPRDWAMRLAREQGTASFEVPASPELRKVKAAAGKLGRAAQIAAKRGA